MQLAPGQLQSSAPSGGGSDCRKKCARKKCSLSGRAKLSYSSTTFGLMAAGDFQNSWDKVEDWRISKTDKSVTVKRL